MTAGRTADCSHAKGVIGAFRVADGDGVVGPADQDFADNEPQDPLLAGGAELVQAVGEAAEEAFRVSASWR